MVRLRQISALIPTEHQSQLAHVLTSRDHHSSLLSSVTEGWVGSSTRLQLPHPSPHPTPPPPLMAAPHSTDLCPSPPAGPSPSGRVCCCASPWRRRTGRPTPWRPPPASRSCPCSRTSRRWPCRRSRAPDGLGCMSVEQRCSRQFSTGNRVASVRTVGKHTRQNRRQPPQPGSHKPRNIILDGNLSISGST